MEQAPSITDEDVTQYRRPAEYASYHGGQRFRRPRFRLRLPHRSIILLRLGAMPSEMKGEGAAKMIGEHLAELSDAFCVFDGFTLRVRHKNV